MNNKQKERLIKALKIRMKQFEANFNGYPMMLAYGLHGGHHTRDILTTLAVLEGKNTANALLAQMPTKKDLV